MITTVKIQEHGYLINEDMLVPFDPDNRHYQQVQEWIADGNTPDPADLTPIPSTPQEEFDARLVSDPVLRALVDQLEEDSPGYRARARGKI